MPRAQRPREIVILAYPGVQSLDITGPLEVFTGAQRLVDEQHAGRGYRVTVLSAGRRAVATSSGLRIAPHGALSDRPARIDTLLIPGGPGCRAACRDHALVGWVASSAADARRTVSVCTGAFLLAEAGLLSGRRATTHWSAAAALARLHPDVQVDPEPIFLRDGPIWTSAGVTAGMDLALALVEEDLDRGAALTIARHLVLFLRRPGNQSQFSATLSAQQPARQPLREVQRHAIENPGSDLSVAALADRAHMSTRHFARAFRAETGITPASFVERVRLEAVRRELEDTADPIELIATSCGFGTGETMRRAFLRRLQVGPAEYRRRFQANRGGSRQAA